MKKINLLILGATALAVCACGQKTQEVTFGVGYATTFTSGTTGTFNISVVAAAFDADGKVLAARADTTQMKISYNAADSTFALDSKTNGEKSKLELGTDYGMHANASTNEAYIQIENWAKGIVGKTAAEATAADFTVSGTTIGTSDYKTALKMASTKAMGENANKYTVATDATLNVGVGMYAEGLSEDGTDASLSDDFAGALVVDYKVVTSYVDAIKCDFTSNVSNEVTVDGTKKYSSHADVGQVCTSKVDLNYSYGMKSDYGSATEFFEHCAALEEYVKGKTQTEVAAITKDSDITGVTASKEYLIGAMKEAVDYSTKDVITDKVQA